MGDTEGGVAVLAARKTKVAVRDVSFSYDGKRDALNALDLDLSDGVTSIVGPSGCGKSTVLSLLSGLNRPSRGSIQWTESDPAERDRHALTMMFQKDTLLPWLTAYENVMLHFRLKRTHRLAENIDLARELLSMIGMWEHRERYPYQLSGGMRRRIAFLAAIAPKPATLLLDEPFSALDEPTRIAIHEDVHRIVRNLGVTVVLVTHDLAEAVSMSDRVVLMTKGPGRVAEDYDIALGEDRKMLDLRESPEFLEHLGILWHGLNVQIQA